MRDKRSVVIAGIGAITPLGNASQTWSKLVEGASGIDCIASYDTGKYKTRSQIAGEIKTFNPLDYHFIDKSYLDKFDRYILLGLVACEESLIDSKLLNNNELIPEINPQRLGVIVSSAVGGANYFEHAHRNMLDKGVNFIPTYTLPAVLPNMLAALISIKSNARGENYSISSACSSSMHAIGESFRKIRDGYLDVTITGGSDAAITPLVVGGFSNMFALSRVNDNPKQASRPFDKNRKGFVLSEGAAIIILAEYELAKSLNLPVYAEIIGYGTSSDAFDITKPSLEGMELCIQNTLDDACLEAEKIEFINTHGTGTASNDLHESKAINHVFKSNTLPYVTSVKSIIGHMLGAAGAIGVMSTALVHKHSIIPPTINLLEQDEECNISVVANKSLHTQVEYALTNSFGFGGTNACICTKKITM